MRIAKIVGNLVATKKDERLTGKKLMIVSLLENGRYDSDHLVVAVDTVGAGIGEIVLLATGGAARKAASVNCDVPTDASIVGIIDDMEIANNSYIFCEEKLFNQ